MTISNNYFQEEKKLRKDMKQTVLQINFTKQLNIMQNATEKKTRKENLN